MFAMKTQACADSMDRSKFLASLRHLPSHAKVRSTTPSARQDFEAFGAVRPLDDLHRKLADLLQGAPQFRPCIATIGKDMAQPRPALEYGFQDGRRAVAVLDVGGVNDDADQQAQRVDDDVPLAALDLLAGVEATNSAAFGGLHRLASSIRRFNVKRLLPLFRFAGIGRLSRGLASHRDRRSGPG